MKFIIGCLAGIGCLAVLAIGGCVGCAGWVVATLPKIPPYATTSNIESKFAKDIKIIKEYAQKNDATLLAQLSTDVYALYLKDDELLKRHHIDGKSYHMSNGAGVGTLRINAQEITCMTYEVEHGEDDYTVFIFDQQAMNKSNLPSGPEQ